MGLEEVEGGKEEVGKEERVNRGEPAGAGRGGRVGTGRARAQELSGRLQTAARAAAPESRELQAGLRFQQELRAQSRRTAR